MNPSVLYSQLVQKFVSPSNVGTITAFNGAYPAQVGGRALWAFRFGAPA